IYSRAERDAAIAFVPSGRRHTRFSRDWSSDVCSSDLFYGYGLNQFGRFDRPSLWLVVVAIWALQLWYSPLWLARFRFGPAEWLRSEERRVGKEGGAPL